MGGITPPVSQTRLGFATHPKGDNMKISVYITDKLPPDTSELKSALINMPETGYFTVEVDDDNEKRRVYRTANNISRKYGNKIYYLSEGKLVHLWRK